MYLTDALSSKNGIIFYCYIGVPGNGKYVVNGDWMIETNDILRKIEYVGYLKTNKISNIVMIPCSSNSGAINLTQKCLHIIYYESRISGLKKYNKVKTWIWRKYDSRHYNVQINQDVKYIVWKLYGTTENLHHCKSVKENTLLMEV